MKSLTAKVITISSQLLVVCLFLFVVFNDNGNDEYVTINNNNFDKMADKTIILFKKEELLLKVNEEDVVVPLETKDTSLVVSEEIQVDSKEEEDVKQEEVTTDDDHTAPLEEENNLFYDRSVLRVETGNLTGYGPDCHTCSGVGKTSTGHNLYDSIYYEDSEYGLVRILAADKEFPFYSIFRVSNVPGMDDFIGIVLDRGGNVGFGKGTLFDLAFSTEKDPNILGKTSNVKFELLRNGK